MDRLIGNRVSGAQRETFYQAIVSRLLGGAARPIILVDWSDFSVDRQQQWLRASLAVGSRAITLFEELHPYAKLGNRQSLPESIEDDGSHPLHDHHHRRRRHSGAVLPAG